MAVCKSCGTEVTGKFCPACGEPVNMNVETSTYSNNSGDNSSASQAAYSQNNPNQQTSAYTGQNQGNYQSSGYGASQQNSYTSRQNTYVPQQPYYGENLEKPVEYVNWLLSILVVNLVPIVGAIILIVMCFDKESESKRNWARAYLTIQAAVWFILLLSWSSAINFLASIINRM